MYSVSTKRRWSWQHSLACRCDPCGMHSYESIVVPIILYAFACMPCMWFATGSVMYISMGFVIKFDKRGGAAIGTFKKLLNCNFNLLNCNFVRCARKIGSGISQSTGEIDFKVHSVAKRPRGLPNKGARWPHSLFWNVWRNLKNQLAYPLSGCHWMFAK